MLDRDAKSAADRFMGKLEGKGFAMARSQNTAENYTDLKQERDSEAVEDFIQTDIFQDIMKMR
ncbi:MAG: hypothetical protein LBD13_00025 [Spirochaetaceae bacterium]|jgi:hypothetical protein|nr:hypothetical protein [Spirochaetaceae bacterium]